MNVYFAASVSAGRDFEKYNHEIAKILEEMGHDVLSKHVVDWRKQLQFRKKAKKSKSYNKYISAHDRKMMNKADIVVAEVSQPSHGVGFEICYGAYVLGIPVVCLKHKSAGKITPTLVGDTSIYLDCYFYQDDNIEKVLTRALKRIS